MDSLKNCGPPELHWRQWIGGKPLPNSGPLKVLVGAATRRAGCGYTPQLVSMLICRDKMGDDWANRLHVPRLFG